MAHGLHPANRDNATSVSVDDDLVVGGVPVILGLLGDLVVAGRHQRAAAMRMVSCAKRRLGCSARSGPTWPMIRSAADFEMPNSGASWRIVKWVRQYEVTRRTRFSSVRPRPAP